MVDPTASVISIDNVDWFCSKQQHREGKMIFDDG
jgi:hypothetical protein